MFSRIEFFHQINKKRKINFTHDRGDVKRQKLDLRYLTYDEIDSIASLIDNLFLRDVVVGILSTTIVNPDNIPTMREYVVDKFNMDK